MSRSLKTFALEISQLLIKYLDSRMGPESRDAYPYIYFMLLFFEFQFHFWRQGLSER